MTAQVTAIISAIQERLTSGNVTALILLLTSCVVPAAVMYMRTGPRPQSLLALGRFMFPGDILRHPSARADFLFWVTRKLIMPLVLLPSGAVMVVSVGHFDHAFLSHLFGLNSHVTGEAGPLTVILFTATMLLAYDFSYYAYHVAQHHVPILWELHKVHHSAEVMVGTTKDRIHPLDEIINRVWDSVVVGSLYGVWLFFSLDLVEATIYGVNVYVMRNILMMDFVRHTHLKVSFGRVLNAIVICPHFHQLHHSTDSKHLNRNFGLMLAVWDRLFGTLAVPLPDESFNFGLGDTTSDYRSATALYILPLRRVAMRIVSFFDWTREAPTNAVSTLPRIEIVRDEGRFNEIASAWNELWKATDGAIFQSYDWINEWWRSAGASSGSRLHIGLAWNDEQLVAILPFIIRRHRGVRVLEWAAKDCSDYCDAVVTGQNGMGALTEMWRQMKARGGFDLAYLSHLRDGARVRSLMSVRGDDKLRVSRRLAVATGVQLHNWPNGNTWFQSLGKKGRNNYARGWRILSEIGPSGFRLLSPDEDLGPALHRLRLLKQMWLDANGLSSPILLDGAALLFELVHVLATSGRLRLFVIECRGEIVAVSVNILENDRLMAFFAAYDPAYERASPGTLLMIDYIKWSFEQGLAIVDFMCGDEEYKSRFANVRDGLVSLVGARTVLGRIAMLADEHADAVTKPLFRAVAKPV